MKLSIIYRGRQRSSNCSMSSWRVSRQCRMINSAIQGWYPRDTLLFSWIGSPVLWPLNCHVDRSPSFCKPICPKFRSKPWQVLAIFHEEGKNRVSALHALMFYNSCQSVKYAESIKDIRLYLGILSYKLSKKNSI